MGSTGRLQDQVAIVVGAGASSDGVGIGQAIALLFAREGARVVLIDLDGERATATLEMIAAEGGEAIAVQGDISDEASCVAAVEAAVEAFGTVSILVNNAAYTPLVSLADTTTELFTKVMAVNSLGPFMMCRAAVPVMIARGGGSIVNIGSVSSIRSGDGRQAAYAASKAALLGLMVDIANEHGKDGVRINTVSPGLIDTPLRRQTMRDMGLDPDAIPFGIQSPLRRCGDPWDMAHAVLFLASKEAGFITGVHLPVDGGLTTRRVN